MRERTREMGSEEERKLVFLTPYAVIMTDKSVSLLMNHFSGYLRISL